MADHEPADPSLLDEVRDIDADAHALWASGDRAGAVAAWADGVAASSGHPDPQLRVTRAVMLANRAKALGRLGRHDEALLAGDLAIEELHPLAAEHPRMLQLVLGRAVYAQVEPMRVVAGRAAALHTLDEAITQLRAAAAVAPAEGRVWLAYALRRRARDGAHGDGSDPAADLAESLALFADLAADDPGHRRRVAETLVLQARLDPTLSDPTAPLTEALAHYRDLAADQPGRHLADVASVLWVLVEHDRFARPAQARAHLDEVIELYRQLDRMRPGEHDDGLAAALLRRCRRGIAVSDAQALADARAARELCARPADDDPVHHGTRVVEALRVEGAILHRRGDEDGALAAARSAVGRARALDRRRDGAMLWLIVAMEDLVTRVVALHGYAAAVPMIDELIAVRRRYRVSDADRRRPVPRTPTVRHDPARPPGAGVAAPVGVVVDPALFGPLSNGRGVGADVLVLTAARESARRALDVAAPRMARVDDEGREHTARGGDEAGPGGRTAKVPHDVVDTPAGVALSIDGDDGGHPLRAARWLAILREELASAGVTRAHLIPVPHPADEEWT